jgi:pre-mRNA cleavage complex 2 protein Pcf11
MWKRIKKRKLGKVATSSLHSVPNIQVPVNQKLPLLYLLDSIMKNLKGRYIEVVNTKMVAIFCHCFEKLTEPKTRISLYRLRQTWNPFIVKKKLAAIDKHVHALDPNWPVTATVTAPTSPTIHVNPDFLPAGEKGGKVFSSSLTNSASSSQASTTASGSSGLQSSRAKTAPAKEQVAPPPAPVSTTTTAPVTLEQKRKNVLEAMKRKKEALLAKGSTSGSTVSTEKQGKGSSSGSGNSPPVRNSSLADPRKKAPLAGSSGSTGLQKTPPVTETSRGKKRSSHSPRRPLSSRSSLSPDYDSKVDGRKRAKVSSRPRSASPAPQSSARQNRHGEREECKC